MKKNIPEFKKKLIERLKQISDDKDFILSVGSYAGQTEKDVEKIIEHIDSLDKPTESDVLAYAIKLHYKI